MSPTPSSMPSIAELRTWLLDCATELADLERKLAKTTSSPAPLAEAPTGSGKTASTSSSTSGSAPDDSLKALRLRLALISEIVSAQRDGAALVTAEQQLFELMLRAHMDRLAAAVARLKPESPCPVDLGQPRLPLEPGPG